MASLNQHMVVGKLGKDPEVKTVSEKSLANFSLATEEYGGKDSEGKPKYNTTWHNITAWGPLADYVAKHGKKGMYVAVVGPHTTQTKDDKTYHNITARELTVIGKVDTSGNSSSSESSNSNESGSSSPAAETKAAATTTTKKAEPAAKTADSSAAEELPF